MKSRALVRSNAKLLKRGASAARVSARTVVLVVALLCVACAPAAIGICLGLSAAGVTAAVVVETSRTPSSDAGVE